MEGLPSKNDNELTEARSAVTVLCRAKQVASSLSNADMVQGYPIYGPYSLYMFVCLFMMWSSHFCWEKVVPTSSFVKPDRVPENCTKVTLAVWGQSG